MSLETPTASFHLACSNHLMIVSSFCFILQGKNKNPSLCLSSPNPIFSSIFGCLTIFIQMSFLYCGGGPTSLLEQVEPPLSRRGGRRWNKDNLRRNRSQDPIRLGILIPLRSVSLPWYPIGNIILFRSKILVLSTY